MVLEIIIAAILLAFGLLSIYFSIEEGISDNRLILILVVGVLSVVAGLWLVFIKITLAVILTKLAGLLLAGFGLFMILGFPDIPDYQYEGFAFSGVFIGIVVFVIGIYFLLF